MCNSCPTTAETLTLTFDLVKDAPTYVEVADEEGNSRAFIKGRQPIEIDEAEQVVTVIVERKLWERRLRRAPEKAPKMEVVAEQPKVKRKCLSCSHEFMADPAYRICTPCKKTAAWRSGADFSMSY